MKQAPVAALVGALAITAQCDLNDREITQPGECPVELSGPSDTQIVLDCMEQDTPVDQNEERMKELDLSRDEPVILVLNETGDLTMDIMLSIEGDLQPCLLISKDGIGLDAVEIPMPGAEEIINDNWPVFEQVYEQYMGEAADHCIGGRWTMPESNAYLWPRR